MYMYYIIVYLYYYYFLIVPRLRSEQTNQIVLIDSVDSRLACLTYVLK